MRVDGPPSKMSDAGLGSFDELDDAVDGNGNAATRRPFIRGSDPRIATCRGKLQNKRSKLNQEINKELRLRAGAENLYKATTNRKLKETVALELSFVNSNLQLLKEQLAELNSSVELYQNDSKDAVIPMIPLGLKETKEIDFREPFKDFILEHYSEDASRYEDAIADLMDTRQAMRTPLRDSTGVALLFRYYNQLYFVERRFFPPDRSLGIYFEWFDSLTGVPSCQRTVAFEKACVLFNIGALYTQIGTKQDRLTAKGLDSAVDSFLRSAGTFRYIHENFTNAPSMDLGPEMLEMLVQLMLAQARECLFEKLELQSTENRPIDVSLDLAQEASQVNAIYSHVYELITREPVKDYVPYSWVALVNVKKEHYRALSHYHCAMGILSEDILTISSSTKDTLNFLHVDSGSKTQLEIKVPKDDSERKLLGRAHLRESLLLHEESQRLQRMCRELRGKQALANVLKAVHGKAMAAFSASEDEDDFREVLDPSKIQAATKFQLTLTCPDFAQYRVDDLFKKLGPVAIFSAKHHWTAPRLVQLHRGSASHRTGGSVSDLIQQFDRTQKNKNNKPTHRQSMDVDRKKASNARVSRRSSTAVDQNGFVADDDDDDRIKKTAAPRRSEGCLLFDSSVWIDDEHCKVGLTGRNSADRRARSPRSAKRSPAMREARSLSRDVGCISEDSLERPTRRYTREKHDDDDETTNNTRAFRRTKGDGSVENARRRQRREKSADEVENDKRTTCGTDPGFGFSVRGDAPVIIAAVDHNSLADFGGVKEGDFIVAIGNKDVKWASHDEVVRLIKKSGDSLSLKLVTPMDRNYLKPHKHQSNPSTATPSSTTSRKDAASTNTVGSSGSSSSSGISSGLSSPAGSLAQHQNKRVWNPFKRNSTHGVGQSRPCLTLAVDNENVILR